MVCEDKLLMAAGTTGRQYWIATTHQVEGIKRYRYRLLLTNVDASFSQAINSLRLFAHRFRSGLSTTQVSSLSGKQYPPLTAYYPDKRIGNLPYRIIRFYTDLQKKSLLLPWDKVIDVNLSMDYATKRAQDCVLFVEIMERIIYGNCITYYCCLTSCRRVAAMELQPQLGLRPIRYPGINTGNPVDTVAVGISPSRLLSQ